MGPQLFLLAKHGSDLIGQLSAVFHGINAQHLHLSFVRKEDARKHFDGGAFSCAVGAYEGQHFSLFHGEGDLIHGTDLLQFGAKDRLKAPRHSLFLLFHPERL